MDIYSKPLGEQKFKVKPCNTMARCLKFNGNLSYKMTAFLLDLEFNDLIMKILVFVTEL